MNDNHDELLELCAAQALGALDAADRARLDVHLEAGCAECEQALAEFAAASLAVAAAAPAAEPAPQLKRLVLSAIAAEADAAPATTRFETRFERREREARERARRSERDSHEPRRANPWMWIAGLGWAAAAACAAFIFFQQQALTDEIVLLRTEQASLQRQLAEERQWSASMASPNARVAFFAPTPDGADDLSGWALFDPSTQRAVLVLENLQADENHDFELWAIRSDGPRSLGVVQVDAAGRALVRLPVDGDPTDIAAFALSYEAKGGSPNPAAPAGPVVSVGSLSS